MFITLEGIEGSGKTTQISYITEYLRSRGRECIVTREPGGTPIGRKIRSILLDPDSKGMAHLTELCLYVADRKEHLHKLIQPALRQKKIVICDRFSDATVVYQGYARGIDMNLIHSMHRSICGDVKPDLTFLLDLPPETGLARAWKQINAGNRSDAETRFEQKTLAFHHKVRQGYLDLARLEAERFHVIKANRDKQQVREDILAVISSMIA